MLQIQDMQKVKLTAKGVSAAGNPTQDLAEPLEWVSSDPAVLAFADQAFPSIYAVSQNPLGLSTITVTGKNMAGAEIQGEIVIEVVPGPTAAIMVEAAAPEPR